MAIKNKKHYSKALLELGAQYGILDELLADLDDVLKKLNENLDLKKFLLDPQIKMEKKKRALKAVFMDFISEKTYNLLFILIKDKKLEFLDQILEDVHKRRREKEDVLEAVIESVVPLESRQEEMIKQTLSAKTDKKILIKNLIEPDLIAGIKIIMGDLVIDTSVRGKLERLNKKIGEID